MTEPLLDDPPPAAELPLDDVGVVLEHLDDVAREPALRRPWQVTTRLTWVLVALVVAAGTFVLGAKLGHDRGADSAGTGTVPSNLASILANRRSGGGGESTRTPTQATGSPRGTGATASGGRTFGTVKLVDGTNVYVETATGVIKVTTTPEVTVDVTARGSLSDLEPGETVTVEGTPGSDSTTMAGTSISQVSGGGFGGGGRGGFGGGASGRSAAGSGG